MTLRKHHVDGHWCNALEKNIKGFIRELDERLLEDMKALSELLLDRMSRLPPSPPHDSWHKPSEDTAQPAQHFPLCNNQHQLTARKCEQHHRTSTCLQTHAERNPCHAPRRNARRKQQGPECCIQNHHLLSQHHLADASREACALFYHK
jgi:hypothetical protein